MTKVAYRSPHCLLVFMVAFLSMFVLVPGPAKAAQLHVDATCFEGLDAGLDPDKGSVVRWAHHTTYDSIVCRDIPRDLSNYTIISFWMHSSQANDAGLVLRFLSNNPATDGPDYYIAHLRVDWVGWKQIHLPLATMGRSRQPRGWDQIDEMRFFAPAIRRKLVQFAKVHPAGPPKTLRFARPIPTNQAIDG